MHLNHSRGTLMSYTDHSAQRCFKSNTPKISCRGSIFNCHVTCRWRAGGKSAPSLTCSLQLSLQLNILFYDY